MPSAALPAAAAEEAAQAAAGPTGQGVHRRNPRPGRGRTVRWGAAGWSAALVAGVLAGPALASALLDGDVVVTDPPAVVAVPTSGPAGEVTGPGTGTAAQQPRSGVPGMPTPWQPGRAAAATPVRVSAPAIGLSADLMALGTAADGSIEVPASTEDAGWLTGSAVPGATGPAVVAGHVDSTDGPAVFFRLRELTVGDAVDVLLSDGSTSRFLVTDTLRTAKDEFPTDLVYGPVPDPQLRLITCGGDFDAARRSYEDNVVVFARLA